MEEINAKVEGTNIEADAVSHYWVNPFRTGQRKNLFVLDLDSNLNQFVTADLYVYDYNMNDHFTLHGEIVTLLEFEEAILESGISRVDVDVQSRKASAVNRFHLRS